MAASLRVFYIHQYFRTPDQGSSSRSWYFTRALAEAGHKPVVITAHNSRLYEQYMQDGVEIHYLPVSYDNAMSFSRRGLAFLKFVWKAIQLTRKLPRADVAYVLSTPLTTGLIGMYLKKYLNIPYLFDVADLWPRAPIEIGAVKNPLLKGWLYKLERKIYHEAREVVALSPAIQKDIMGRMPDLTVSMIPNMADSEFFYSHHILRKTVEKDDFYITYFGAAGLANHLEFLLDAAEATRETLPQVKYRIIAEGARLADIKNMSERRGLTGIVSFLEYMPKQKLKKVLQVSDAVYVSFKDLPVLETGSPNKFFDGLAAGKMIITNFGGWIADLIGKHGIGFSYTPHMPEQFVEKLQGFVIDRQSTLGCGTRARQLAEKYFSRREHTERFVRLIEKTAQSRSGR